jgi:hypothetical protein
MSTKVIIPYSFAVGIGSGDAVGVQAQAEIFVGHRLNIFTLRGLFAGFRLNISSHMQTGRAACSPGGPARFYLHAGIPSQLGRDRFKSAI